MKLKMPSLNDSIDAGVVQAHLPDADTYNKILNEMVLAFLHKNKSCSTENSTEKYCRAKLNMAITGFKEDGSPWRNAPGDKDDDWYTILKKRLRMLRYDIDKKKYISNNRSITGALDLLKKDNKKEKVDIEEENKPLSLREKSMLNDFKESFRKDFPMSTTVIDDLMMNRLGMMYVLSQRDYENLEITNGLTNEIIKLSDSLGLSGKHRISQFESDRSGTIEQLIEIYNETRESYIDIEKEYKLEEMKLILNAIDRGTIDEFLGIDYIRRLYGDSINGEEITYQTLRNYLANWEKLDGQSSKE